MGVMTREELLKKAIDALLIYVPDPSVVENISETQSFKNLGIDSMYIIDFSIELEDQFNIRFTDEETAKMKDLKSVVDLLLKKTGN
jgi:acyl carrier protein